MGYLEERQCCKRMKAYILLYGGILIYSFSSLLSKAASSCPAGSIPFLLLYGCSLGILAIYALIWQQILKRFPLTTAYSNRAFTVVLGMIWGTLFFQERITVGMLLGAACILCGIRIVVSADES